MGLPTSLLPDQLSAAIARGATVLAPGERAARTLRRSFDEDQHRRNLTTWEPPRILSWTAWTAALWRTLVLSGRTPLVLLNRAQEHLVWRTIIAADSQRSAESEARSNAEGPGVAVNPAAIDALARMAASAWRELSARKAQSRLHAAAGSTESRALVRWVAAFDRRAESQSYLRKAQLEARLQAALEAGSLAPGPLVLFAFAELTPAQASLVAALRKAGGTVEELDWPASTEPPQRVAAGEEKEELAIAAHWLRKCLEANPASRLAVLVPDLATSKPAIDRVFLDVLAPERKDIRATSHDSPYEFALGTPLGRVPLVAALLESLRWAAAPLSLERVSDLLRTPLICADAALHRTLAEYDAFTLRQAALLRPELSVAWVIRSLEGSPQRSVLSSVLSRLRGFHAVAGTDFAGTQERPFSDWAERIRKLLLAVRDQATRDDSVQFQARQKWESLLDELATLDFEAPPCSWATALTWIERLAEETVFSPESNGAPIQIMTPADADGLTFDAVWFLRAADLSWPAAPASNPLLPSTLARDLGLSGSSAATDLLHAKAITRRIVASSCSTLFSYAQRTSEGRQRPSAALSGFALTPASEMASLPEPRAPITLEAVPDSSPLPMLPDRVIRGGATILQLQAACGFRAFGEKRLFATALDTLEPGMDARTRGNTVHHALEVIWTKKPDQESMRELSHEDRAALIDGAIDHALASGPAAASPWDTAFLQIERRRLQRLLGQWIEIELTRSPFTVELMERELKDVAVGPLRLTVRIDRIDQTPQGAVIIDYKTGPAHPSDWMSERPDAPQLPLYAILSQATELAGVAFAQVRPGKDMGMMGVADHQGLLLTKSRLGMDSVAAQVEEWRRILVALATDFYHGNVHVNPKNYPTTCKFCQQRILCRLDAAALHQEEDQNETESELDRDGSSD